ncbi:MAG TPA: copper chaperone PCu(A)C [Methylomirabilota bacterium]|jgi:copper(I)-binding protein|nr:copper chaperone PCu(A)C [Methylomirabilota bacterium]
MRRRAALAALLLLLGGCYYRPSVMDTGGVRIRTENGRAVRQGADLLVTFDLVSTGAYGDTIVGVASPVAKQAVLVDGAGGPVSRMEIPGASTVKFTPADAHIVLSALQRPVERGETFIVTLLFEKSGGIGVVTLLE